MSNSILIDDPEFAPARSDAAKEILPAIRAELADGERLVWVGPPRRSCGLRSASSLLFVGILQALGCGVALLIVVFEPPPRHPGGASALAIFLGLTALVLLCAGSWDLVHSRLPARLGAILPNPLRVRYERRLRATFQALTDRRIILWEPAVFGSESGSVRVRSFRAKDLSGTSRTQRPDGSGEIALEVVGPKSNETSGLITLARIHRVDDVRAVEALIRATLFVD